jgi:hypothetical protein
MDYAFCKDLLAFVKLSLKCYDCASAVFKPFVIFVISLAILVVSVDAL